MLADFRLRSVSFVLVLGVASFAPTLARSGGTRTFQVDDFSDFESGEVEGAAIEKSGQVTVGYLSQRTAVPGTTAFSCLSAGSWTVVGTSDAATIQRVRIDKKTGKPGLEQVAELDGVVVSAMAALPSGDLVAATIPGGKIHRVSPSGKVTPFAQLAVEQIWQMTVHRGRLLVATGPKGELFSLSLAGGDAKVVLDVDENDLLSLAVVEDRVLVGTAPGAKLFEVTQELEGTLLHDFSGDEVRGLALTRRGLAVAINDFEDRKLAGLDTLKKQINRASLVGQPPAGSSSGESSPKADAEVRFVDLGPDRDVDRISEAPWEEWLTKEDQYFTGLLPLADGATVLVSSSDAGRIYRLRGVRDVATIADLEERKALGLCQTSGGTVLATAGDGAAVYALATAPAREARYHTEVFDAEQPARFGAVHLRGVGPHVLRARTGPSAEPDDRWGQWTTIELLRSPAGLRGSLARMPKRRYLQLEIQLAGPAATVRSLQVFYGPENLAPLLSAVDVATPSFDDDDDDEPDPEVTIAWKADARDGDDLVYQVQVRPEGGNDDDWIRIDDHRKRLGSRELKWDVTSVPNGVYEVAVTASDSPANGSARARTDRLISAPVVVDRERPTIKSLAVNGSMVSGTASDDTGYIHDVTYSVDAGQFQAASAVDGLFDDRNEAFELRLPDELLPGRHRLVVRARDAFGNFVTQAIFFDR